MDWGWVTIGISVVLALIGGALSIGALYEKVKGNRVDIDDNKLEFREVLKQHREENRQEHISLGDKLDSLLKTPR